MKYQDPKAILLVLDSKDAICASFTKTEIKAAEYSENKDVITFDDLIK